MFQPIEHGAAGPSLACAAAGVHALVTCMLAGLIWFVQVAHYPLLGAVGERAFARYQTRNLVRTTWVVAPLMLAELASAAGLLYLTRRDAGAERLAWIGMSLLASIWISTAAVQVPLHARLERAFDARAVARLTASNWVRTLAWSARAVVALELWRRAAC